MKSRIKNLVFLIILLAGANNVLGQQGPKKIYFLADTITVDKNSRMLEIVIEGPFKCFGIMCRCVKPYHQFPSFTYRLETSNVKTFNSIPKLPYIAIKDLVELLRQHGNAFDDHFTLQIVEVLPNKKYQMADQVRFVKQRLDYTTQ